MAATVLTTAQLTTDAAVDTAMANVPPLPDNVLLIVRNLQAQVTALSARVTTLGG